ncbi:MAG TPA: hypothetical protein VFT84_12035 [Gemmatimonadales bacterium]|nr:hypothetical protein [Gemmatimonadales bacterium]
MGQALSWTMALSFGLAAGCGPGGTAGVDRSAQPLERDLTLRTSAPVAVEVASAVELGRPEVPKAKTPRRRSTPRPAPAPSEAPPRPEAAPAPEPVAVETPAPVTVAAIDMTAPVETPVGDDRELAPGETITIVPVSSDPGSGGGGDIALPTEPGRGVFSGGARGCPHPPRGISGGRPIGISRLP